MKIFWSWQSDTPGKIGRHFVREALETSIARLKADYQVEEPTTASNRSDVELDHDTKGVPGSPGLADVIFAKIASSSVFVADVTPVAAATDEVQKGSSE